MMENLMEGFRFRPTDTESLTFLLRFIAGENMNDSAFITTNVDVYGELEPWEIYSRGARCGDDDNNDCSQYRFFITKLKKKNKSMYRRNVGKKGSWKQQDVPKPVQKNGGPVIGNKKNLCYVNKGYNRENGHWLMKEYDISKAIVEKFDDDRKDYVFCAIKMRSVVSKTCLSETSTAIMLNDVPEENGDNLCRNLENEPTALLNFEESAHEAGVGRISSTNYDHEALQGVAEAYDAGEYMQSSSVPELDGLELMKRDLEVSGGNEGNVNIVADQPLLAPYNFEETYIPNFNDEENVVGLDFLLDDALLNMEDIDEILQGIA